MRIGVVSGLPREAACLNRVVREPREFVTSVGLGPRRAGRAARAFIESGASALMSFGVAGGLSTVVPAGTIVLATAVVDGENIHLADEAWVSRLELALINKCRLVKGSLAGTNRLVSTSTDKRELHRRTSALACDMESHAIAGVAASYGIPFVVVRAISDSYDRNVPDWVIRCLTPAGDIQLALLFFEAMRRPYSLGQLAGLTLDAKKAFNSLRRVAIRLGPSLCFQ